MGLSGSLFVASALALAAAAAAAADGEIGFPGDRPSRVRAMTMNVFVGTNMFRALDLITDPENDPCMQFYGGNYTLAAPCATAQIWDNMVATDFPARAKVLADHIERTAPDVLGLQEILTASHGPFNPNVNPADPQVDEVYQDFMEILQSELKARSLAYDMAGNCTVIDIEMPSYEEAYDPTKGVLNRRITMKTALLVNTETSSYANTKLLTYDANPNKPLPLSYCAVIADADIRGETGYQAVATHLMPSTEKQIQHDQAIELVDYLKASDSPKIIMGDLNADPGYDYGAEIGGTGYDILTEAGYEDMWLANANENATPQEGTTYGNNATLNNEVAEFTKRLDYVLYKQGSTGTAGGSKEAWMDVLGDNAEDSRTPEPEYLWMSDHASVFADLVSSSTGGGSNPPTAAPSAGRRTSARDALVASAVAGFLCLATAGLAAI